MSVSAMYIFAYLFFPFNIKIMTAGKNKIIDNAEKSMPG